MQPADRNPVPDRPPPEAELDKLPKRDAPVLALRELGDPQVTWTT